MNWWFILLSAIGGWGALVIWGSRASVPAYRARAVYQWVTLLLLLALSLVTLKAWAYRMELRFQIELCGR